MEGVVEGSAARGWAGGGGGVAPGCRQGQALGMGTGVAQVSWEEAKRSASLTVDPGGVGSDWSGWSGVWQGVECGPYRIGRDGRC